MTSLAPPTPAEALWDSRAALAKAREQVIACSDALAHPVDLSPYQWAQLMAMAIAWRPDLIVELGRGSGNSTAAFAIARGLGGLHDTRILSICLSTDWHDWARQRLEALLPGAWFEGLAAEVADITRFDFAPHLAGARKVFVFWDAHGYDVAEAVLCGLLPLLEARANLVAMHDLTDARYHRTDDYAGMPIWRGGTGEPGAAVRLGHISSRVEQSVSVLDFATRNGLPLDSAEHSLRTELSEEQGQELATSLGPLFSLEAHWFYLSVTNAKGTLSYPVRREVPRMSLMRAARALRHPRRSVSRVVRLLRQQ